MTVVSVIVPLRDQEREVATTIRTATQIFEHVTLPQGRVTEITFEILALDERSGDNTLSVLSVLHGRIAELCTVQDVDPGASLHRASKVARGQTWLIQDKPIAPMDGAWALTRVFGGARAAAVPGEVLVVPRPLGQRLLRDFRGGLVSAQNLVGRFLHKRGEELVMRDHPQARLARARLLLRGGLGRLGLSRFDRPTRDR